MPERFARVTCQVATPEAKTQLLESLNRAGFAARILTGPVA
jgi:hypothetical protein